ncbi:MAG: hypothetical protein ACRD2Z_09780 [Thermoanaerobaculia bacterium]
MADLVDARWVATYVAELGKTLLVPGETVVKIPRGEAEASDNWEVVIKGKPREPGGED